MITDFRGTFLSNFYPCRVEYGGEVYNSAEHAYQAAKCRLGADAERIRAARTAAEARRLGRHVALKPNWSSEKVRVMYEIVRAKFSSPELRRMLVETGDEMLVEVDTWGDTFWGVCRGSGHNWLGRILMKVRDEVR